MSSTSLCMLSLNTSSCCNNLRFCWRKLRNHLCWSGDIMLLMDKRSTIKRLLLLLNLLLHPRNYSLSRQIFRQHLLRLSYLLQLYYVLLLSLRLSWVVLIILVWLLWLMLLYGSHSVWIMSEWRLFLLLFKLSKVLGVFFIFATAWERWKLEESFFWFISSFLSHCSWLSS